MELERKRSSVGGEAGRFLDRSSQKRDEKDAACEVGLKREDVESQGFKKENESALLPAAKGRDVHLVVSTEVTRELGDGSFKGEVGTEASLGLRRGWS